MSLGVCLSGGGVKGAAHIGMLEALREYGIKPDYIAGTSSGSIAAALYSIGYTPKEMIKLFRKYAKHINYIDYRNIFKVLFGIIFKRRFILDGLNSGVIIEKIINSACKEKNINNISDIKIPLIIPSVDLHNGDIYMFSSTTNRFGFSDDIIYINDISVGEAVRASCSYPGVFSPFRYNNRFLIDGGIRDNTPWKELKKLGADKVVCVTFEDKLKRKKENISILDVISRKFGIIII